MKLHAQLIFLLLIFIASCKPFVSSKIEKNPYRKINIEHPSVKYENYKLPEGWENRVYVLDGIHLDYSIQMNRIDNFKEVPEKFDNIEEMKKRVKAISLSMNPILKKLFNKYLFGIYFCKNLGSTGLAGAVYQGDKPLGGFVILDYDKISHKANDWITNKINSVFSSTELKLRMQIENEENDNETNALRYILIHEFGHILSYTNNMAPLNREEYRDFRKFSFYDNVWKEETISLYDDTKFPLRSKVIFYSSKKLILENVWKDIFPYINESPFPTLYSVVSADEFFAEYFVSYVHCILEKRPWILSIYDSKGTKIHENNNGIFLELNSTRKKYFDTLFHLNQ